MTEWPNDARAAVAFTFDFDAEEVWIGEDPANADRPGILSQGTYGAKVAVPLVLEVLDRRGVRATLLHPGPGRGASPRPRGGDRRRRPRDRPSWLHAHLADEALTREEEEAELVEGAGGPGRFRRRGPRLPVAVVGLQRAHSVATRDATGSPTRRTSWTTSVHTATRARRWSRCRSNGSSTTRRTSGSTRASGRRRSRRSRRCGRSGSTRCSGISDLGGAAILTCHPQIIARPGRIGLPRGVHRVRSGSR